MAHLFTVWNITRVKKVFVIVPEGENLLERLILKGKIYTGCNIKVGNKLTSGFLSKNKNKIDM